MSTLLMPGPRQEPREALPGCPMIDPTSVKAAEVVLRHFAGRVTQADVRCASVAAIRRHHVEDYLVWLRARPGATWGTTVSEHTVDHREQMGRVGFRDEAPRVQHQRVIDAGERASFLADAANLSCCAFE